MGRKKKVSTVTADQAPTVSTATEPAKEREQEQQPQSLKGYFRDLLTRHPEWVNIRDYGPPLEQWRSDNNADEVPQNVKLAFGGVKAEFRTKGGTTKKRGPKPKGKPVVYSGQAAPKNTSSPSGDQERLEEVIAEAVSLTRSLNGTGRLDAVLRALRIAMAKLVLSEGEGA